LLPAAIAETTNSRKQTCSGAELENDVVLRWPSLLEKKEEGSEGTAAN